MLLNESNRGKGLGLASAAAAQRRTAVSQANRVRDGQPLSALKATSAPGGVRRSSASLIRPDGGRRSASLFDLPSSGSGLVSRLRAQVRPSSPLNALGSSSAVGSLGSSESRGLASLTRANSQRASLRSSLARVDTGSRLLLSAGSAHRTQGGFGLASITRSALDLIA